MHDVMTNEQAGDLYADGLLFQRWDSASSELLTVEVCKINEADGDLAWKDRNYQIHGVA